MKPFEKFKQQVFIRLLVVTLGIVVGALVLFWLSYYFLDIQNSWIVVELFVYGVLVSFGVDKIITNFLSKPLELLSQGIIHVSPDSSGVAAPVLDDLALGHELITELTMHVYALATTAQTVSNSLKTKKTDFRTNTVANSLPLPLLIIDHNQNISFRSEEHTSELQSP